MPGFYVLKLFLFLLLIHLLLNLSSMFRLIDRFNCLFGEIDIITQTREIKRIFFFFLRFFFLNFLFLFFLNGHLFLLDKYWFLNSFLSLLELDLLRLLVLFLVFDGLFSFGNHCPFVILLNWLLNVLFGFLDLFLNNGFEIFDT